MLLNSASKHIPRGRREAYIPCWDEECEDLLLAHKDAKSNEERDTAASDLHNRLNEKRRERWTDMVESIDFTHSSRRAWHTINKLTGRINTSPPCPITANSIATTLVRNGRFPNADKTFARQTNSNVHKLSSWGTGCLCTRATITPTGSPLGALVAYVQRQLLPQPVV